MILRIFNILNFFGVVFIGAREPYRNSLGMDVRYTVMAIDIRYSYGKRLRYSYGNRLKYRYGDKLRYRYGIHYGTVMEND